MRKHTPGPWTCSRYPVAEDTYDHAIFARAADDARAVTVATVYPISDDGQPGAESHANARLIETAPRLLAALNRLAVATGEAEALTAAGMHVPAKVWQEIAYANDDARAAIAAATADN